MDVISALVNPTPNTYTGECPDEIQAYISTISNNVAENAETLSELKKTKTYVSSKITKLSKANRHTRSLLTKLRKITKHTRTRDVLEGQVHRLHKELRDERGLKMLYLEQLNVMEDEVDAMENVMLDLQLQNEDLRDMCSDMKKKISMMQVPDRKAHV